MIFNEDNNFSWRTRTFSDAVSLYNAKHAEGFRLISLSLSGSNPVNGTGSPRYTAVMAKSPNPFDGAVHLKRTESQFQHAFEVLAAQNLGPYIIAATGAENSATFAGAWRPMNTIPVTRLNLSATRFLEINDEQLDAGNILVSTACFGSIGNLRYCGVWMPNPMRYAWNVFPLNADLEQVEERFRAMRTLEARPDVVAATPEGGLTHAYTDARLGDWTFKPNLNFEELGDYRTEVSERGLYPYRLSASGVGSNTRFAAIFTTGDLVERRPFRKQGFDTSGATSQLAEIDRAMQTYMQTQNLRGVGLAVVHRNRLVLTRGYTLAESSYPDITPLTLFRQASVSKTFCAIAVWQLIQQGDLSLDTTLQSVLDLRQGNGAIPVSPAFNFITVANLLESCSGIAQGSVREALAEWRDTDFLAQPMLERGVAEYIAAQPMTAAPGSEAATAYGRTDYYLLGRIVAARMGAPTFAQAFRQLVMDPMGMSNTRNSRSIRPPPPSDEALYHRRRFAPFQLVKSMIHTDRRDVPIQYGGFNMDVFSSAGGMSSSVVDMARLCAMLGARNAANPGLRPDTVRFMMGAASFADAFDEDNDDHGFHGFDTCEFLASGNNAEFRFAKGGVLEGCRAYVRGDTNGYMYAVASNTDPDVSGASSIWFDAIDPWVRGNNWGRADLFADRYGMTRLN